MSGVLRDNKPGPWLTPAGPTLLPHQKDGVAFAISRLRTNRGAMIGDVMGLGKTIEAIVTANVLGPRRILVVCPASVLLTWRREIWKWQTLGLPVFLIHAGYDTTINHALLEWTVDGWFIINYDILTNFSEVKASSWDLLIVDESHKVKNPEAIRTQQLFGSGVIPPVAAEKVLLLTGTPMVNYVHDLYTQLHFLDSAMWPSFPGFIADHYFPGYRIISPSQVIGEVRDLQGLRRKLTTVMIRRSKAVLNLPPKDREIIDVDINDNEFWSMLRQQGKLLRRLQCQLMKLLDEALPGETSDKIRDLQDQINRIITTTRYKVGMKKVLAVIYYLTTCCTGKTLVFAYHHDVIMELVAALADRGVVSFTGGSSLKDRDRAADRFQRDPDCQFFIGNIEAAGQGITLTAARHVVFAEPDWRGTYLEQAEDRAHRIGQRHPVLVTYLLLRPNAWSTDSWMATKTTAKQTVIDTVLGTPAEENSVRTLAALRELKAQRFGGA